MKATNCGRYTFELGEREVKYDALRLYVCDACGGGVAHRFVWDDETETSVDSVVCGACGGEDIISESRYLQQVSEAAEAWASLPPAFRKLYAREEPKPLDAEQAMADLFG